MCSCEEGRIDVPAGDALDAALEDTARRLQEVVPGEAQVALTAAVREANDHAVIGRCQLHDHNVRDHVPEKLRGPVPS